MLLVTHLNYAALVVGALVNIIVGALWYSPVGFGRAWSILTGLNMMDMPKAQANKAIAIVAGGAIIQTLALAVLIYSLNAHTALQGLSIGLLVWLGFTAATTLGDMLYSRRGWKLWWLNSSFFLLVQLADALILSKWR
jgi:Protein of unknown function (DUF1761)